MTSHALDVLREVHAESSSDLPFALFEKVYRIESERQFDDDPQVRHSEIRTLVTLAVDDLVKDHSDAP